MDSTEHKDKKTSKTRHLSPSFKRGGVKESKLDDDDDFKINIMQCDEEDDVSPKRSHEHHHKNHKHHSGHEDTESEVSKNVIVESTNAIKPGRVKKIGYISQAGKGEDGFTKVNQDSYLVIQNEYNLSDFKIFGVLDGHGVNGHLVSKFVTKYFCAFLKKNKKMNCLKSEDEVYHRLKKNSYDILIKAFKHAERDIGKSEIDAQFSGTTCVMVFQVGQKIICANVGDSRAIMVKKEGKQIIPLSIDQKPNDPAEKKRIESNGGEVSQYEEDGEKSGPFRVWMKGQMYPGIAMSRSIGDIVASSLGVFPVPEFIEETIDEDTNFIVACSDGVWEFLDNKAVCELVMPFYKKNDPEGACQALIKESTKWWNKEDIVVDDITVIAAFF